MSLSVPKNKAIWILVGTRPEVIKQSPVYRACVERLGQNAVALVGTGQHRELLTQALEPFGVALDFNLELMEPGQSLSSLSSKILEKMGALFSGSDAPKVLVVQGDTTSAAMAAWAAFQNKIPVVHNEAGLRSYDLAHPFPEEANRRLISVVASRHCAPTERARQALLREGVAPDSITMTGNPGIDSLLTMRARPRSTMLVELMARLQGRKPILLTAHRRENAGESVERWFAALRQFLLTHPELALIYPVHPNQMARAAAEQYLKGLTQVHLIEPLGYLETCQLLGEIAFAVTDSGGIQEEAATLGKPVVVCRQTTERMEAVDAGIARLAGTEVESIIAAMEWAVEISTDQQTVRWNPIFGDGQAAPRITDAIMRFV